MSACALMLTELYCAIIVGFMYSHWGIIVDAIKFLQQLKANGIDIDEKYVRDSIDAATLKIQELIPNLESCSQNLIDFFILLRLVHIGAYLNPDDDSYSNQPEIFINILNELLFEECKQILSNRQDKDINFLHKLYTADKSNNLLYLFLQQSIQFFDRLSERSKGVFAAEIFSVPAIFQELIMNQLGKSESAYNIISFMCFRIPHVLIRNENEWTPSVTTVNGVEIFRSVEAVLAETEFGLQILMDCYRLKDFSNHKRDSANTTWCQRLFEQNVDRYNSPLGAIFIANNLPIQLPHISKKLLNTIIPDQGIPVAYKMFGLYNTNDAEFINFITTGIEESVFNRTRENGDSLAHYITRWHYNFLIANNYLLARKITPDSLNTINMMEGESGSSVAFRLVTNDNFNPNMLARIRNLVNYINDVALNSLYNADDTDEYYLKSVAFELTTTDWGLRILSNNNYSLAQKISTETLNTILTQIGDNDEDEFIGVSVAFMLTLNEIGRDILEYDDFALAKKINLVTLNNISNSGESVRSNLLETNQGRRILSAIENNINTNRTRPSI